MSILLSPVIPFSPFPTVSGILLSHEKNAFESVLMRWMGLEPVIQSEISQKNKYHILTYIYMVFRKNGIDEPICRGRMEMHIYIYLFLAVLGLHCCVDFSLVVKSGSRSYSPVAVQGLLTAAASLVVEHGLQKLWLLDSRLQAQ